MDEQQLERFSEKLHEISDELTPKLQELHDAVTELTVEVGDFDDRLNKCNRKLNKLRDRLNASEKQLASLPKDSVKSRLNDIESIMSGYPSPEKLRDKLDDLDDKIDDAKTLKGNQLHERIQEIESNDYVTNTKMTFYLSFVTLVVLILEGINFIFA